MSRRAWQVCPTPGCPELTRVGKCDACQAEASKRYRSSTRRRGHSSAKWRALSKRYRETHPYCEGEDHAGEPEILRPPSAHVDHLDGLGPNGPRGFDEDNLQALCVPCHSRRTGRDFGGFRS